jgi:poly-gamma-glutamate synthesis protein (capsule biosynthesis protein)
MPKATRASAFAFAVVAACLVACRARDRPPSPVVAAALTAPAGEPPVRVLVAGDVLPHRPRLLEPARIAAALEPLGPLFGEAAATVVNYETATGDPEDLSPASQAIALAAPPAWMSELAKAHVTAITAANNHACDLGEPGLDATLETAGTVGIVPIGADPRDPWRPRVVAREGGHSVCAVAWSTFVNEPIAGCVASGKIAVADFRRRGLARIERAVEEAKDGGKCDAVVAILHGGDEYVPQVPGPIAQAKRAANAGADAVIIHHPHVPSPVAVFLTDDGRRVPIFTSVGNLVSNQGESWKPAYLPVRKDRHVISLNAWTRLGVVADLRFRWPDGAPRGELEWGFHLVWTENEHAVDRAARMPRIEARPLDPAKDTAITAKLASDPGGPTALFRDPCWIEATGTLCK